MKTEIICKQCGIKFFGYINKSITRKFCSRSCSSKYNSFGKRNGMFNKHHTEESKQKNRQSHWKGGSKLSNARKSNKRRQFGFLPINLPFKGSEGHHLDLNYVLFIPKKLHKSISHSVTKDKNMKEINLIAIKWYEQELI